jgi:hypothetical protein
MELLSKMPNSFMNNILTNEKPFIDLYLKRSARWYGVEIFRYFLAMPSNYVVLQKPLNNAFYKVHTFILEVMAFLGNIMVF